MTERNSVDLYSFYTTKLTRWKGNYPRIFSIGTHGVTTYNHEGDVTNTWQWTEVYALNPLPSTDHPNAFQLCFNRKKGVAGGVGGGGGGGSKDSMRFECDAVKTVLTLALKQSDLFCKSHFTENIGQKGTLLLEDLVYKFRHGANTTPTILNSLKITPISIEQRIENCSKKAYFFKDIDAVIEYQDGFAIREVVGCVVDDDEDRLERLHFYKTQTNLIHQISSKIQHCSTHFLNHSIQIIKQNDVIANHLNNRFSKQNNDYFHPLQTFKSIQTTLSPNSSGKTFLQITQKYLLERDMSNYNVTSLKRLKDIYALVRVREDRQEIRIEFKNNAMDPKVYSCNENRDVLLVAILDCCRASGNTAVHVKSKPTEWGNRWVSSVSRAVVDEKIETLLLKYLHQPPPSWTPLLLLTRFNTNIEYTGLTYADKATNGLFADNKEKLILVALNAMIVKEFNSDENDYTEEWLNTMIRLLSTKTGFAAFSEMTSLREKLGTTTVQVLKAASSSSSTSSPTTSSAQNSLLPHVILTLISNLMTCPNNIASISTNESLRLEQDNKTHILSSPKFLQSLLSFWKTQLRKGTDSLITLAMMDVLVYAICVPYSETTVGAQFDNVVGLVGGLEVDSKNSGSGEGILLGLFEHPSLSILKSTGLLMKCLIEEGETGVTAKLQDMALRQGAVLRHLITSLFNKQDDPRSQTLKQLSRHLVQLWSSQNDKIKELLSRIFPPALLLTLLNSDPPPPSEDGVKKDLLNTRDNLQLAASDLPKQNNAVLLIQKNLKSFEKFVQNQLESPIMKHWKFDKYYSKVLEMKNGNQQQQSKPIILRKRRQNLKLEGNWPYFYYAFEKDWAQVDLIWNDQTRSELKSALTGQLALFQNSLNHYSQKSSSSSNVIIEWNYTDFHVSYKCLENELKIGDYYLKYMLENDSALENVRDPKEFFYDLYHRFLLSGRVDLRSHCLHSMTLLYQKYGSTAIGPFVSDLKYFILMLEKSSSKNERDLLVLFLKSLLTCSDDSVVCKENGKELVNSNGLKPLTDLLTLCHLHTGRATTPLQTQMIEYNNQKGANQDTPEWYYYDNNKEKQGPLGFTALKELFKEGKIDNKTRVWASGLDGWKPLQTIPQCKWSIIYESEKGFFENESKLGVVILDIFIKLLEHYTSKSTDIPRSTDCDKDERNSDPTIPTATRIVMIRPLPLPKQILTSPQTFPHIVQTLLTFDPSIVERVARLLCLLLADNPLTPHIYQMGVYYFILMYTGSNILPISRFLELTHLKQVWSSSLSPDATSGSTTTSSILTALLPPSLIHTLINHGPNQFSKIFLGEFDTPEAIWNAEMRRNLIEKIALHLCDFTPRLRSNVSVIYEYLPIVKVPYDSLRSELFCGYYYLRNLTDVVQFPEWPIKDPLKLLKDVLSKWRDLLDEDKKPLELSVRESLKVLEIDQGEGDVAITELEIKRAYRRLAAKWHPDKNPQGRSTFELIQKAYQFLCLNPPQNSASESVKQTANNQLLLLLKTQCILYSRYKELLAPYKYAGYPHLFKMVHADLEKEDLFKSSHEEVLLLPYEIEVLYWTLDCCELNVEEVRREGGLPLLLSALDRCTTLLTQSSKDGDAHVRVCVNAAKCFGVATGFQLCIDKLIDFKPTLSYNISRLFHYDHLLELSITACEVVSKMSVDTILQMHLFQSGIVWYLVRLLFKYDYTAEPEEEEGESNGAVKTSDTTKEALNTQQLQNLVAKKALLALKALAGTSTTQTPQNALIHNLLQKLLMHCFTLLKNDSREEIILKLLNSNSRNAELVWDNEGRTELLEFCAAQLKTLTIDNTDASSNHDPLAESFNYTSHMKLLYIRNVFVQLYNEDPSYKLSNPEEFFSGLLEALRSEEHQEQEELLLTATCNVLKNVNELKPKFTSAFIKEEQLVKKLLFRNEGEGLNLLSVLLEDPNYTKTLNHHNNGILNLLLTKSMGNPSKSLNCLLKMTSDRALTEEFISKGGPIYVVSILFSEKCSIGAKQDSEDEEIEKLIIDLLHRLLTNDELVGQRTEILLKKFLPCYLVEILKEGNTNAEKFKHLFNGEFENGVEFIWGQDCRLTLNSYLTKQLEILTQMNNGGNYTYSYASLNYPKFSNELCVGGVYLRFYCLGHANWKVRNPSQFLRDLLEQAFNNEQQQKDYPLILQSLCNLLTSLKSLQQQNLLLSTGYFPEKTLKSLKTNPKLSCLLMQFFNKDIVENIDAGGVKLIIDALKMEQEDNGIDKEELVKGIANIWSRENFSVYSIWGEGARSSENNNLVGTLMILLKKKAALSKTTLFTIVKILQSFEEFSDQSEFLREEIVKQFEKYETVWSAYRGQKPDLFLEDSQGQQQQQYLLGNNYAYLTNY